MPIQNVSTFSPAGAEQNKLDRQRMMAQMLQQQAASPLETRSSRGIVTPNSPLEALGKLLQGYSANKQLEGADAKEAELGKQYQQKLSQGLQGYTQALQGTPDQHVPADGMGPFVPGVKGDRKQALAQLLQSDHPMLQQFGMAQMAQEPDRDQRQEEFGLRREDAQLARETQQQQFAATLADRQQGREDNALLRRELKSAGAPQSPYFQPVQTAQGVFAFNARTGRVEPVSGPDGNPIIGAQADPSLQGAISGAKESGKVSGKATTEAQIGLPQAMDTANMAIKQIDDLLAHPGFTSAVGATLKPFANRVHGTPEADFTSRLDQLKGGAFLQAFEALKGGGQITEIEGKKATDAITRMSGAQSEKEFTAAAREFQDVIRRGAGRAAQKAGGQAPAGRSIDDILKKYQ